jgi:flagellar biosynthetic protein FlhB
MSDQSSEKQHQATAKRLDDLRSKGQILRSRDLVSGLIFMITIIMLVLMISQIKDRLEDNFILAFNSIRLVMSDSDFPESVLSKIVLNNFYMLLPIFIVVLITALLSPFAFGGWNFTLKALHFKFESLNPFNNLGNIFSKKIFINILKSMLKVTLILGVLFLFSWDKKNEIISLINMPVKASIVSVYLITKEFVIIISSSLIFIIMYDVVTSYFEYQGKVKMTTQELKDEMKDTEGNVDIKRRLRAAQFAILKQRLSISVPKATVVVTNPTHYAIAIRYDEKKDRAPRVLAKGKGHIAHQIRQIAITNRVPIYQAPLLARAIYNTSKLNKEINPGLYMAVAIVLSYVHQLKNYQHGLGQQPQFVSDLKIPDEFIYDE